MARKKKNEPDKLAQEVRQAIAAGMSYGKWKAMQPVVAIDPKAIPDGWKACEYCGKGFKPTQGKRFCDIECRRVAYKKRTGKDGGR